MPETPWTWKGRTMSNSVLIRLHDVREKRRWFCCEWPHDVHLKSQSHVAHEDLCKLLLGSASLEPCTEVVLKTTVDDAQRVRYILDVNCMSQR